ncbi:MAG: hypothetical protein L3J91_02105, partial [Thermoplasmata archaeon]|nr:hypothetical protein [Thermoplasmata archaeon]
HLPGAPVRTGAVPVPRLLAAILPAALPTTLVAVLWTPFPALALLVLGVALALTLLARKLAADRGAFLSVTPLVGAVAFVAVTAAPGAAPEALLGLGGLGLLVWLGATEPIAPRLPRLMDGLLVPGLALGVALSISTLLPVARQSVGAAAILLVAALGLVGWGLLQTGGDPAAEAVPPSL